MVDNHSADDSTAIVRSEFSDVRLIENSENLGFSKANNQGIREANGRYILLLNSDTIVRPGALQAMTGFMDAHPEAGGVTCRLLNADGTVQPCVGKQNGPVFLFFRLSRLGRLLGGDRTRRFVQRYLGFFVGSAARSYLDPYNTTDAAVEVETVSGACVMLRREAVNQVGLLDEAFFMYCEDIDYCLRLREAGWKLYYVPGGEIVHLGGRSSGGRMRNFSVHSFRSLFYYYRKHFSRWTQLLVRLMVFSMCSVWWLANLLPSIFSGSEVYKRNRIDLGQVIRLCFEPPADFPDR